MVMNSGRIEQIGTPEDVYGRPATTFVAGFIGSPPMNLLKGEADGSRFMVGGQTLALPSAAPRGGTLTLGARPEHVDIDPAGAWAMKVDVQEMLGAERLVYGHIGDASFTLRIDGTLPPPKTGEMLHLRVAPEHVHWFDAQSGVRVG
jgi:sn-glycerol 3-phosphate transport system ATP-binding protein